MSRGFIYSLTCRKTWSTGVAIFSMFFGAGNIIFPLLMGINAGEHFSFGLFGLLISAVGGPLLGLLSVTLFRGEIRDFFCRTGKLPGIFLIYLALALLGPFAVLPRCIIVAYAAMGTLFPEIGFGIFTIVFCLLALLVCLKRTQTLNLLGYILSPILLICLSAIIIEGWLSPGEVPTTSLSPIETFNMGLLMGYDTLDLIAALLFGPTIWHLLRVQLQEEKHVDPPAPQLLRATALSAFIGGGLLAVVYLGLSLAANHHGVSLANTAAASLMPTLAYQTLGPVGGALASTAIAIACFTTVIALAVSVTQVLLREIPTRLITENHLLLTTVALTGAFAMLGFDSLMSVIHPIVVLFYPAIITITLCNIFYKLWGWTFIKIPFYTTLSLTIAWNLL